MNRFAAMQLWPVFWKRAVTATSTAFSTLASWSTMKGSEPPSSSTTGLIARPAASPTATPAASEPVRVTAEIRRSPISSLALRPETTIVLKTPGAAPARSKAFSSSSAQPVTLEACLSTKVLPAETIGVAARIACQSG